MHWEVVYVVPSSTSSCYAIILLYHINIYFIRNILVWKNVVFFLKGKHSTVQALGKTNLSPKQWWVFLMCMRLWPVAKIVERIVHKVVDIFLGQVLWSSRSTKKNSNDNSPSVTLSSVLRIYQWIDTLLPHWLFVVIEVNILKIRIVWIIVWIIFLL